eukprot:11096916-Ditylum_brightwellii.AAC.1
MEDICKATVIMRRLHLQLHGLEGMKCGMVITTACKKVLVVKAMMPTLTPMLTKDVVSRPHFPCPLPAPPHPIPAPPTDIHII